MGCTPIKSLHFFNFCKLVDGVLNLENIVPVQKIVDLFFAGERLINS